MARALTAQSWGRLPLAGPARIEEDDWRFRPLPDCGPGETLLADGARRSYGDSCINSGGIQLGTRRLNRFMDFDTDSGVLRCDAGLTLDEILQLTVPLGWFLPVVPGTRYVTVGGAIANDIHGKNHHAAGSFGCHVLSLDLLRSDGVRYHCSEEENRGLFSATVGGLGLTGLITAARLRLRPIASDGLCVENLVFSSPEEFAQLSRQSMNWEYTVSWVDVVARRGKIGRGIFSRARHCDTTGPLRPGTRGAKPGPPFSPPVSLINNWTVDLFNRAYFQLQSRRLGERRVHYQPFFFPLDGVANWNRAYGRRGFYQYQCIIPRDSGTDVLRELLRCIAASGEGSFLVVLKEFGEQRSPGLMSFPRPGFTLALDFANRGARTLRLLDSFDAIVMSAGGALYPAKDARMSVRTFHQSFPNTDAFADYVDPVFSSSFWRRVRDGI